MMIHVQWLAGTAGIQDEGTPATGAEAIENLLEARAGCGEIGRKSDVSGGTYATAGAAKTVGGASRTGGKLASADSSTQPANKARPMPTITKKLGDKQERIVFHIRIVPFALTRLNRLSADGVQNMDVKPAILGLQGQILQQSM
jgi:hypothetical protein